MNSDERVVYLVGGPLFLLLGYVMLRGGWWLEERFRIHFVGSGALVPWVFMLLGLYLLARGVFGI